MRVFAKVAVAATLTDEVAGKLFRHQTGAAVGAGNKPKGHGRGGHHHHRHHHQGNKGATNEDVGIPGANEGTHGPSSVPGANEGTHGPSSVPGANEGTWGPSSVPGANKGTWGPSNVPGANKGTWGPSKDDEEEEEAIVQAATAEPEAMPGAGKTSAADWQAANAWGAAGNNWKAAMDRPKKPIGGNTVSPFPTTFPIVGAQKRCADFPDWANCEEMVSTGTATSPSELCATACAGIPNTAMPMR